MDFGCIKTLTLKIVDTLYDHSSDVAFDLFDHTDISQVFEEADILRIRDVITGEVPSNADCQLSYHNRNSWF
jgi:hypothetical protein